MKNKEDKNYPEPIVGAIIVNKEGKLLLSKGKKWEGKWTVFGGHVELGELAEESIRREVKEEAGIDVSVIDKLGFCEGIFDKDFHEKKHFVFLDYLCLYEGNDHDVKTNEEFEKEFIWVMPEEALEMDITKGARKAIEEYVDYKKKKEYLEAWKRCVADFENYKKRQAESQKEMIQFSSLNMIMQLLPVVDNFRASTEHIPEDQKENPWVTGIMYIQKQLEQVLIDNGVEKIDVKPGDSFDPEIHEAVENKECKPEDCKNVVKKVVVRGYKMGERVIRAARVIVE